MKSVSWVLLLFGVYDRWISRDWSFLAHFDIWQGVTEGKAFVISEVAVPARDCTED